MHRCIEVIRSNYASDSHGVARVRSRPASPLWHDPDFLKLWAGQSLSELGTGVTRHALPTTAILLLGAGPLQVGAINTLQSVAYPLLGLPAGAVIDRVRRRPVLVAADTIRMVALGAIPALYFVQRLQLWQLFAIALAVGVASVFFEVAYRSSLPGLIGRDSLVDGNSKLQMSRSVSLILGPGLAALLMEALRAAPSVLADALSYLASVATLLWIRKAESVAPRSMPREARPRRVFSRFACEIAEGLTAVVSNRIIRGTAIAIALSNGGWQIVWAVLLLFAYRNLRLSPGIVGGVFAVISVISVLGTFGAPRVIRWLGIGPVMVLALFANAAGEWLLPLASLGYPVLVFAVASTLNAVLTPSLNVCAITLRQTILPPRLLARTNATSQTMNQTAVALGALVGGLLGMWLGVIPAIVVGGAVTPSGVASLLSGPASLRQLPEPTHDS